MKTTKSKIKAVKHLLKDDSHSQHHLKTELTKNLLPHIFESCGIETEPTYEITKETILKYNMKDEFPDVFEVKLEVGKWYKNMDKGFEKSIACVVELVQNDSLIDFYGYGFSPDGSWFNFVKSNGFGSYKWEEASHQEVETALRNEAVKRGFVNGVYCKWPSGCLIKCEILKFKEGKLFCNEDQIIMDKKGTWASVLETKTIKEAEELLNCKII